MGQRLFKYRKKQNKLGQCMVRTCPSMNVRGEVHNGAKAQKSSKKTNDQALKRCARVRKLSEFAEVFPGQMMPNKLD